MANPGEKIKNGETCNIEVAYVDPNGLYEIDIIDINGQYPDVNKTGEAWSRNAESNLTIKALKGLGYIALRHIVDDKPAYEYISLGKQGDGAAVNIPAGSWYAYESRGDDDFTVMAVFQPPFKSEQYLTMSEADVQRLESSGGSK